MIWLILLFITVSINPQTDLIKKYKYMYEGRVNTTPEIGGYFLNKETTNQYLQINYSSYFENQPEFAYECWFNASTFTPNFEIGNRYTGAGNQRSWRYYVSATQFRITYSTDGTGTTVTTVNINYSFNTNTNYHIVAVYVEGVCSLYVNGSYVGMANITGGYFQGSTAALRIGVNAVGTNYAVGKIYLVRYYNFILGSSDVMQLYNNGRPDLVSGLDVSSDCVIELLPDRAGKIGWANSIIINNNMGFGNTHAECYNSPTPLTVNNKIIYDAKSNITGNTTLTNIVPAGYSIKEIIFTTLLNNNFLINISGVTSGGTDILSGYIEDKITYFSDINIFLSMLEPKSIYLQSSDWGGSVIAMSIKMEKIN